MNKKKVVVGMSGGVDSSVAAHLLKERGYEVIGASMRFWQEEAGDNQQEDSESGNARDLPQSVRDAAQVADHLGIPFYVKEFGEAFRRHVVDYFIEEYLRGRTPNPCIACNRHVKWEALLSFADEAGADYVATGHYARVVLRENGRYAVSASKTARKDQTYALFNLTQEQLSRTLMPVGEYEKEEVRKIAETIGLCTSDKPDSQEICFIPDHDYAGFIGRMTKEGASGSGNFVTADGAVLGRHKGIVHYTVGQRKGLGLSMGEPVFVTEIRPETNEVVIGKEQDVFCKEFLADQVNFMGVSSIAEGSRFLTKIRYAHPGAPAALYPEEGGRIRFVFDQPQRAATPGQAAVFYDGDCVAGGGIII